MARPARTALVVCDAVSRTFTRGGVGVAAARGELLLESGMRVAITGPSGSGKSTLLHLLAGLDTPNGGVCAWPGLGGPPRERPGTVSVVFQGPSLVPALDARRRRRAA